jgi:hypothetical protein
MRGTRCQACSTKGTDRRRVPWRETSEQRAEQIRPESPSFESTVSLNPPGNGRGEIHGCGEKRRLGVSARVIVRRAYDLAMIDAAQYRTANVPFVRAGQARDEPGDNDWPLPEAPELLSLALAALEQECQGAILDLARSPGFARAFENLWRGVSVAIYVRQGGGIRGIQLPNRLAGRGGRRRQAIRNSSSDSKFGSAPIPGTFGGLTVPSAFKVNVLW